MNIDITPIDGRDVDITFFLAFAFTELKRHIALVKDRDYRKIALSPSNQNNFKLFFDEILPLTFFLETKKGAYSKIKYISGNQKGDAVLDDSILIEITKAQNNNKYIANQDMLNHGYAFSTKSIQHKGSSLSPTKTQPYVHTNNEHVDDVASYIHEAIKRKLKKNYPRGSILIILFESDTLMVECDGDYSYLEKEIKNIEKDIFSKIYILENFLNTDLRPKWQLIL